jgi:hypothetical protein
MQVLPKIDDVEEDIKMMQEMNTRTIKETDDERQENLQKEVDFDEGSFLFFL